MAKWLWSRCFLFLARKDILFDSPVEEAMEVRGQCNQNYDLREDTSITHMVKKKFQAMKVSYLMTTNGRKGKLVTHTTFFGSNRF